jgi:hypothetical protein
MDEMNPNNFIWIDALYKLLSTDGENRSSLSCTYQKLFQKYLPAFFEMGSSMGFQRRKLFDYLHQKTIDKEKSIDHIKKEI